MGSKIVFMEGYVINYYAHQNLKSVTAFATPPPFIHPLSKDYIPHSIMKLNPKLNNFSNPIQPFDINMI